MQDARVGDFEITVVKGPARSLLMSLLGQDAIYAARRDLEDAGETAPEFWGTFPAAVHMAKHISDMEGREEDVHEEGREMRELHKAHMALLEELADMYAVVKGDTALPVASEAYNMGSVEDDLGSILERFHPDFAPDRRE